MTLARSEGKRRERIRHQIQPEEVEWLQRQREAGSTGDEKHQDLGEIAAEQIEDELPDVVVDNAAFFDGRGHGALAQRHLGAGGVENPLRHSLRDRRGVDDR